MTTKKIVIGVLAVLGAIFLIMILRVVFAGFSSTAAPSTAIQRAKCQAECKDSNLSENCDAYCTEQLLNQ